jgi:hypothetical protein
VTDTAIEARAETGLSYGTRLLLTAALLGLYVLGYFVPLPGLAADLPPELFSVTTSILALGITPLVIGFALVEIFSLSLSSGRRIRARGDAGRATLNRAALATSLIVSALQGVAISRILVGMTQPNGLAVAADPGPSFQLLIFLTLTASTAAVFLLGNLISAVGIGNGFALLMATQILWWNRGFWLFWRKQTLDSLAFELPGLLLVTVLIVLLVWRFRKADDAWTVAFPQGILPVLWTSLTLPYVLPWFRSRTPSLVEAVATLVLVALFSWLMYHLFSSRPRLEASLTEPEEVVDELNAELRARMKISTAILAIGAAALWAWADYRPSPTTGFFTVLTLAILVATTLDVRSELRFLSRNGRPALLARLDNVHFADRLALHLEEAGIDSLMRGYRLRALYFFFGALFKIDAIVPAEELDRAREVLVNLEGARELEAF